MFGQEPLKEPTGSSSGVRLGAGYGQATTVLGLGILMEVEGQRSEEMMDVSGENWVDDESPKTAMLRLN
jgi:hypothetical protein